MVRTRRITPYLFVLPLVALLLFIYGYPLVKMFDYADELRSLTQGRASSTMAPHAYAPAPDDVLRTFLEG